MCTELHRLYYYLKLGKNMANDILANLNTLQLKNLISAEIKDFNDKLFEL